LVAAARVLANLEKSLLAAVRAGLADLRSFRYWFLGPATRREASRTHSMESTKTRKKQG